MNATTDRDIATERVDYTPRARGPETLEALAACVSYRADVLAAEAQDWQTVADATTFRETLLRAELGYA